MRTLETRNPKTEIRNRPGVVLIAVLVVIVLLGLAAYQYADLMTAEAKAADSAVRARQARALAASGVYFAAALLSDKDSYTGRLGSNPFDNAGVFQDVEVTSSDNPRMHGRFSVVAPLSPDETSGGATGFRYGVTDEAAMINLNALLQIDPSGQVLHDALMKLPNMSEEIADAIIDWIDPDDDPRANGAESQYYGALTPGYRCKNGPLDSLEELLLVRGVTPELLFGSDRNRNGVTDAGEATNAAQPNDRGWSAYLTVYSRELNIDSDNQPRTYLNDSDVNAMYDKLSAAVGAEVADFILAYRLYGAYNPQSGSGGGGGGGGGSGGGPGGGSNQNVVVNSPSPVQKSQLDMNRRPQAISSIFALANARVGIPRTETTSTATTRRLPDGSVIVVTNTSTTTVTTVYSSPLSDPGKLRQYLPILLDKFSTRQDTEIPARINVNTASAAVLAVLPGLDETDVQAIVSKRPAPGAGDSGDPVYQTSAWLLTEANLTPAKLQALERYVTARPQVFRIQSVGQFERGGPAARIEAVVDTNAGKPRIVYWRNLSELGRGFDLPR